MTDAPAIHIENLTVAYDRHPAVHHLNGCFPAGCLTAITGPNGAGKSTLIKTIAGFLKPSSGRVVCDVADRRHDIAYLPQQTDVDRSFPISVADLVAAGTWRRFGAFGGLGAKGRQAVADVLAAVGMEGFEARPIGNLSRGQFQRVLFARLMLQDAPVVLLDEPFVAMDARTTADLLALVESWSGCGKTVVAVLHEFDHIRACFPHTLLLAREAIGWGDTADVLCPANIAAMKRMSEAWDEHAEVCARGDAA